VDSALHRLKLELHVGQLLRAAVHKVRRHHCFCSTRWLSTAVTVAHLLFPVWRAFSMAPHKRQQSA
jgi:hypothetical protein